MIQLLWYLRRLERLRGYDAAKAKRRAGLFRVAVFGSFVSVGVGTCAFQSSARAEVREASMTVGAEMIELADLLRDPHAVSINGERMNVASGSSGDGVHATLDRFEAHCRAHEGVTADVWRKLGAASEAAGVRSPGSPFNVLRDENEREGTVVCLVKPDGHPAKPVFEALGDFARTHDLGALGALRYVYVRRARTGAGSTLVTAWTDDKFDLGAMLPDEASEPAGTDSPSAPRPPGDTHRLLSARIEGTPYGVRVYQSSASSADVYGAYDRAMGASGWKRLTAFGVAPAGPDDSKGHGYLKDGVLVAVSAQPDPNGGSVVSIGDLGGGDTANPPVPVGP
jgi:hypothetical protein